MTEHDSYPCRRWVIPCQFTLYDMRDDKLGKASDYPIMHEHVCDENVWECMRMYDSDSYSGEGSVMHGRVALYDMHDNEWACVGMTEND